jgi:hypothetical protein
VRWRNQTFKLKELEQDLAASGDDELAHTAKAMLQIISKDRSKLPFVLTFLLQLPLLAYLLQELFRSWTVSHLPMADIRIAEVQRFDQGAHNSPKRKGWNYNRRF